MSERKSNGRRQRKNMGGLTNLNRKRWKFLSTVEEIPIGNNKKLINEKRISNQPISAVDIDGDGIIDVREMRMAKYLNEITSKMTKNDGTLPTDSELHDMQVQIGRYTIAQEFIQRNKGKLWRYGPTFADKTEDECVGFIANHKNYKKIVPYLEFMERRRTIRSSGNLRSCLSEENLNEINNEEIQTWIYTTRKIKTPSQIKKLAVEKAMNSKYLNCLEEKDEFISFDEINNENKIFQNNFGVIDIDGDGVIDDYEMQLHKQLKESEIHQLKAMDLNGDGEIDEKELKIHEKSKKINLQAEGRYLMAKDFVTRNSGNMFLYNSIYKNKTNEEIIDLISNDKGIFSKTMNHLRAKERVYGLKSSKNVLECLMDPKELKYRTDPSNWMTPRQVKSKTELENAQRDRNKNLNSHGIQGKNVFMKNLKLESLKENLKELKHSQSTPTIGLPKLYSSPIKLNTIQDFRITKWKTGDK